ncbi:hypothetical protein AB1Y20_003823 [Prymnesium parvum]|uniref:Uncharacterized protein n=1 Tax=Prymnesium parvum TaxID=97485 RepID=A0AB34J6A3_PRYPA
MMWLVAASPALRMAPPVMQQGAAVGYAPAATASYSGGVVPTKGSVTESTRLVQGGSLLTWSYRSPMVEQVQVDLSTEGRPLDADIELWHGPDNTPTKMRVYVENGKLRPFNAVIETPRGPNTIAIRNIGQIEFPLAAKVSAQYVDQPVPDCFTSSVTVQGGALRTYPFDPSVDSVQILLRTDGRPLNARIELLQGPNNNKQVIELYTENGLDRPFLCFLQTPGSGNVIRVVNTAPIEFPMTAAVVPYTINEEMSSGVVLGGDVSFIGADKSSSQTPAISRTPPEQMPVKRARQSMESVEQKEVFDSAAREAAAKAKWLAQRAADQAAVEKAIADRAARERSTRGRF